MSCNVVAEACALPFPSSVMSAPDVESPTGIRVQVSDEANFAGFRDLVGSPSPDGFSFIGGILTVLPGPVDPATLPLTYEASLAPDAAIRLIHLDATASTHGDQVPFRVEVVPEDETAPDAGSQLVVITPRRALEPSSRYAVVLTDGLRTPGGEPHTPNGSMTSLLSPTAPTGELRDLWDYYADLRGQLTGALGVEADEVVQLWDFHTRSLEGVTTDYRRMAQWTRSWLADHPPQPTVEAAGEISVGRRYDVSFELPIWRETTLSPVHRDPDGVPSPVRYQTLTGILIVADNATEDQPAIPVFFGHGLTVSAELMVLLMEEFDLTRGPYAIFLMDWDLHGERGGGLTDLLQITGGLNMQAFAGTMLQSSTDYLVATEVLQRMPPLPDRGEVLQKAPLFYLGNSLGSLVGVLALTEDPYTEAAVLNVGGGGISHIVRDGTIIGSLGVEEAIADAVQESPPKELSPALAVDALLVMSQLGLDPGDPLGFARLIDLDRTPVVVQEALGDGVMPNFATELLSLTMDLPMIAPTLESVAGLEIATSPTEGDPAIGLTQFRLADDGYDAHFSLSRPPMGDQALDFFGSFIDDDPTNDGDIRYTCDGPGGSCDLL